MATSIARNLSRTVTKFSASTLSSGRSNISGNLLPSRRLLYRHRGSTSGRVVGGAAAAVGISYALFGFSFNFGKKEDQETDPLLELYRKARLAHMQQDLQAADSLYHDSLKLADKLLKANEIPKEKHVTALTMIYDGLADIALQTGQVETAEKLFKETMKGCLQQGMESNHNTIVEISLKLASLYAMQGKKLEAEEGYRFCIAAQNSKMEAREKEWKASETKSGRKTGSKAIEMEEAEKDTAGLLGMSLGSYGRFLLYEKRYQEALPVFERACLYAEHTLGKDTNQYLVSLNDLATLFIVTKNFDKAETVLREGIKVSEKSKLTERAMLYCNLGAVHLRRGEASHAMNTCQQALKFAKETNHQMAFRMAEACVNKSKREQDKAAS